MAYDKSAWLWLSESREIAGGIFNESWPAQSLSSARSYPADNMKAAHPHYYRHLACLSFACWRSMTNTAGSLAA